MVALCSGDFMLHSDTSSIMPCQLVIDYTRLNECVFSTLGDFFFLQVDKWRILRSNAFASNSVSNGENLLRGLFRCCNRLMERIAWAVRNVTSGTGVSNRAERPSKTTPKSGRPSTSMDDDHVDRRLTVREVAAEVGICKSSCHLILTEKGRRVVLPQNLCSVCWRVSPYPWIFYEAWDDCCPPAALLSRFGPCGLFLVPEVEILTKRSPISDGRGDG